MAVAPSPLGEARTAYERHDWRGAVALYRRAMEAGDDIAASDLERLGKASWWMGDREGCLDAHERAYAAYLGAGDRRKAAKCAQMLRFNQHTERLARLQVGNRALFGPISISGPEHLITKQLLCQLSYAGVL